MVRQFVGSMVQHQTDGPSDHRTIEPMKLLTAQQMREIDRAAITEYGIASLDLMERAGEGVADAVRMRFSPDDGAIVIVTGKGNNGGDGFVAARLLIDAGYRVTILVLNDIDALSPDARANAERLHVTPIVIPDENALVAHRPMLADAACIVDGILGTGLERDVDGIAKAAIDAMNAAGAPIVAIDIPSGLSADTGDILGHAINADLTVTFGCPKRGLFLREGLSLSGIVETIDIGLPSQAVEHAATDLFLIEPAMFAEAFAPREAQSHKGTFGTVALFAGSRGHLGAGILAGRAALRTGAGLVHYALPESAFVQFDANAPELMCDLIPDGGSAHFHPDGLEKALALVDAKTVAAIGPAIGTDPETASFLNVFVKGCDRPLVIDADGLNLLDRRSLEGRRAATILTPHPGEMARLMHTSTSDVQDNRLVMAKTLSAETGAIVVLKGHGTIVAAPDGMAAINPTGNPGMATAGMGDALTGIIAAFLAQGVDAMTAAMAGVWCHGLAGDIAADHTSQRTLIASDVIEALPEVFGLSSP